MDELSTPTAASIPLSPQELCDFYGAWDQLAAEAIRAPRSAKASRFGELIARAIRTAELEGLESSTENLRALFLVLRKAAPPQASQRRLSMTVQRVFDQAQGELAKMVPWALLRFATDPGRDLRVDSSSEISPPIALPSLGGDQVKVMRALQGSGVRLLAFQVAECVGLSERTVRNVLNQLAGPEYGYVAWPHGARKGAALTDAGVRALTQIR